MHVKDVIDNEYYKSVGHPWPGTNCVNVKHKAKQPLSGLKMLFLQTIKLEKNSRTPLVRLV
jgi:hypothetical protein